MLVKQFRSPLFVLVIVSSMAFMCSAQIMELTIWSLSVENSLPQEISATSKGTFPQLDLRLYFAESGVNRLAELQPATNRLREWEIGEGPVGVYAQQNSVYCTLAQGNAVVMVDTDTNALWRWPIPTANSWPKGLEKQVSGAGLYFAQRSVGQVACLSPEESEAAYDMRIPTTRDVVPDVMRIDPVIHHVEPSHFAGGPPMTLYMPGVRQGVFVEWTSPEVGTYVEQVASWYRELWFVDWLPHISVLRFADNPTDSTCDRYELPSEIVPVAIAVDRDVWFADVSSPVIGQLNPTTGDVYLWHIPGGVQPFDLAVDRSAQSSEGGVSKVWFTDRGADTIGYLDTTRSEIVLYPLPHNTFPTYLTKVMDELWFTAERGNLVGKLNVFNPATGQELPEWTGCTFSGHQVGQVGYHGELSVYFTYDGGMGLPVWVGLEVLNQGVPIPGFVVSRAQLDVQGGAVVKGYPPYMSSPGNAGVLFIFDYEGTDIVQSDMLRVYLSDEPEGRPFCYKDIGMITTWTEKP